MKNKILNIKATSIALAISAAIYGNPVIAADTADVADTDNIEVIQVSGIRGSLVRSLSNKRFADSIVDGISAEDIGKFPDQNVAESLQRVTGVTIDRGEAGEGQQISIRGFGPDFNNVLLNNRTVPTDNAGRGFSFDLVAAELISGADVHKTLRADTLEGGLGGTVNVKTARPFSYDGFKAAASVKGIYDTLSESTGPTLSALVSQNFNDDFGVLASVSYQQRDGRLDGINVNRYGTNQVFLPGGDASLPNNDPQNQAVFTSEKFRHAQKAAQRYELSDRERIGGTLVAQWAVSEDLLITADVLYSSLQAEKEGQQLSRWFSNPIHNAVSDDNTVTSFSRSPKPLVAPGVLQLFENGTPLPTGQWNSLQFVDNDRDSKTTMVGINADWSVTDNFTVKFDLQNSSAKARSENNPDIQIANPAQTVTDFSLTGRSFLFETNEANFNGDPANYYANNIILKSNNSDDDITEARIDTEWVLEDAGVLKSVKAGVYYSDREKEKEFAQTPWGPVVKGMYGGFYANVPASLFGSSKVSPKGGFLTDHDEGGFLNSWYTLNTDDVISYFISDEAKAQADNHRLQVLNNIENGATATEADAIKAGADKLAQIEAGFAFNPAGGKYGPYTPVRDPASSWTVTEETIAAYIEANLEGEDWSANFGLRYVDTDTSSISSGSKFVGFKQEATTNGFTTVIETGDTISSKGSYTKLLPSMNLKIDLSDDLVARFSYSESLTRPGLGQLISRQSVSATAEQDGAGNLKVEGQINGQNPNLKPYTSSNVDLALEWYYDKESYVGATYFSKNLTDWIVTSTKDVSVYDSINNTDHTFSQTSPFNSEAAEVTGLELALLHNFDNGFGIQANYTILDTTAAADETSDSKVGLNGLSKNSYNIIGYYEQGPLQARIAYNWREGYTECNDCVRDPLQVDDYGQVDASISYDINETFTAFAEVINLLDEDPYKYSIYKNRLISITDTGSRYSVGVRATF